MPCRLEWATTPENYRMTTIDATLRHALEVSGRDLILTLDPALQGLPETANELGLRVRLEFDADAVRGTWQPRACFRRADGSLAPAALTTLLDEAAFWLGVLATGESGMTTELRVSLHRPAPFGARVTVTGARGAVRPRGDDPRYQETEIVARADGQVVATARITFVVVRGAARRLVTGMLAINDPTCVRRVFPAYT